MSNCYLHGWKNSQSSCPACVEMEWQRVEIERLRDIINRDALRTIDDLRDENKALYAHLKAAKTLVDKQAEDEGLWFQAQYISEDYLQRALRKLHEVVEGKTQEECAIAAAADGGGE